MIKFSLAFEGDKVLDEYIKYLRILSEDTGLVLIKVLDEYIKYLRLAVVSSFGIDMFKYLFSSINSLMEEELLSL